MQNAKRDESETAQKASQAATAYYHIPGSVPPAPESWNQERSQAPTSAGTSYNASGNELGPPPSQANTSVPVPPPPQPP